MKLDSAPTKELVKLRKKALKLYENTLYSYLSNSVAPPYTIDLTLSNSEYRYISKLWRELDEEKKNFFQIEKEKRTFRSIGEQSVPKRIVFETFEHLLKYLKRTAEFERFVEIVKQTQSHLPALITFVSKYPFKALKNCDIWPELLRVCNSIYSGAHKGLLLRELQIEVETKFIEENSGILRELLESILPEDAYDSSAKRFEDRFLFSRRAPYYYVKVLDQSIGLPFEEFATSVENLMNLDQSVKVIVVENRTALDLLPPLNMTVAVCGGGFQVERLRDFLTGRNCLYWGDIDLHGIVILSRIRALVGELPSILMDKNIFYSLEDFQTTGAFWKGAIPENLTDEERNVWEILVDSGKRLEQERVPRETIRLFLDQYL